MRVSLDELLAPKPKKGAPWSIDQWSEKAPRGQLLPVSHRPTMGPDSRSKGLEDKTLERHFQAIRDGKESELDETYYQQHKGAVPVRQPAKPGWNVNIHGPGPQVERPEEQRLKELRRERHARGFSQERWDHYLLTHGGRTPDQVEAAQGVKPPQVIQRPDPGPPPVVQQAVRVHHAPAPKLPKAVPIEHQPSWFHEHPKTVMRHVDTQEYTFTPEKTIDRFEGRNQVVRPGRIDAPPDTTHANVERPPHVDVGSEAPPPQANVPQS